MSPIYLYQDIIPAPPGEEAGPDESSLPVDMAEADEAASSGETADMGNLE